MGDELARDEGVEKVDGLSKIRESNLYGLGFNALYSRLILFCTTWAVIIVFFFSLLSDVDSIYYIHLYYIYIICG